MNVSIKFNQEGKLINVFRGIRTIGGWEQISESDLPDTHATPEGYKSTVVAKGSVWSGEKSAEMSNDMFDVYLEVQPET